MKKLFLLLTLSLMTSVVVAKDISNADTGTYVVLQSNSNKPTDTFFRLSKDGAQWVIEGKKADRPWAQISCNSGCDYQNSSTNDIGKYFSADWLAKVDISCIHNIVQAFCRFNKKENLTDVNYVVATFVKSLSYRKPVSFFLRRVEK